MAKVYKLIDKTGFLNSYSGVNEEVNQSILDTCLDGNDAVTIMDEPDPFGDFPVYIKDSDKTHEFEVKPEELEYYFELVSKNVPEPTEAPKLVWSIIRETHTEFDEFVNIVKSYYDMDKAIAECERLNSEPYDEPYKIHTVESSELL